MSANQEELQAPGFISPALQDNSPTNTIALNPLLVAYHPVFKVPSSNIGLKTGYPG